MVNTQRVKPAPLEPQVIAALLARERIVLTSRLLPGVVHNLSGAVQTMSLPLDLARLAQQAGDLARLGEKLSALREGMDRLGLEAGLLAMRSLRDAQTAAEPLDLSQMAAEELDFWRADLFVKHDLDLERELTGELSLVSAAPADAALAFNLLMANAVEAVRDSGAPWIKVAARAGRDRVALLISDSGSGPPPEMAGRLFEPFSGGKGGNHQGLGLFLAAQALKPWGGEVAWLPEEPRTTFRLSLPRR